MASTSEKHATELGQVLTNDANRSSFSDSRDDGCLERENHVTGTQLALVIFGLCLAVLLVALVSHRPILELGNY